MDLQPTLEQRLILINQYKILEKLYPEEAETYSQHREILEEGYTLHYNDLIKVISAGTLKQFDSKYYASYKICFSTPWWR